MDNLSNNLRIILLLVGLCLIFLVFGDFIAGLPGLFLAAFIAILTLISGWVSSQSVLSVLQAKKIDNNEPSAIRILVKSLAEKAGVPIPAIYLIESDAANAFAVGRNPKQASIAVTRGLISALDEKELMAVLAQEIAHIRNEDTFLGAVTADMGSAFTGLADSVVWLSFFGMKKKNGKSRLNPLVMRVMGPIAAFIVRACIKPASIFEADRMAVEWCGHPEWLASALKKIETSKQLADFWQAETHPAMAHLFIVNPLVDEKLAEKFAMHPSTDERIIRLNAKNNPATAADAAV